MESPLARLNRLNTRLGIAGMLLIYGFLFTPITSGRESENMTIYLTASVGDQWGFLLLTPVLAYLLYLNAWAPVVGVGVMLLCNGLLTALIYTVAEDFLRVSKAWRGQAGPPPLQWGALALGILLFTVATFLTMREEWGQSKTILLSGGKATADSAASKAPSKAPSARRGASSRGSLTVGDFVSAIDWGWWGIALLAFAAWPLGLLLYFAYSRSGDDKGDAALIGAGLGLGLMVLRFVYMMSRAGT